MKILDDKKYLKRSGKLALIEKPVQNTIYAKVPGDEDMYDPSLVTDPIVSFLLEIQNFIYKN